ncbi:MAG: thioredoxin [Oscillospiraceae bacterium]|nr:thioredoxin [Oscillospiraceae bacterium]
MSVLHVGKSNFDEIVMKAQNKVLLDFWAPWCGPCQMIGPVVEEIAQENEHITVCKINVDEEVELAVRFGVSSIPTLVVMEKGEKTGQLVGYRPKADIEKLL